MGTNNKGETPLYLAARYGHVSIVNCLIEHAKIDLPQDLESGIQAARKMLRITNKKKDTALHEAVRQNQLAVVLLLLKEDPDFSYSANDAGETPLYLAIERNFGDVALKILESCGSPSYGGPLGRTALHAAVIRHDNEVVKDTVGVILKYSSLSNLLNEEDFDGNTPFHHQSNSKDIEEDLMDHPRVDKMAFNKLNLAGRDITLLGAKSPEKKVSASLVVFCVHGLYGGFLSFWRPDLTMSCGNVPARELSHTRLFCLTYGCLERLSEDSTYPTVLSSPRQSLLPRFSLYLQVCVGHERPRAHMTPIHAAFLLLAASGRSVGPVSRLYLLPPFGG
ncbi:hypothetical protein CJ030_MR1G010282 [Morella rubra]|uniref:Uncharacterized protein n=1 Tax=Morella rubra TaxID=262757 RepID=A0A6A1WQQ7_9ROSI|nr:hypothetical protein CJ030_MR1G010282 [Morella rubra]